MNSRRRPLYDVREWPGFEDKAIRAFGSFGRWELVKEFIESHIARDPRIGQNIPGTPLYAWSLETYPRCTIYYTIDDENIDSEGHQTGTITLRDVAED